MITGYLPYEDLLRLQLVSKPFSRIINPQLAPEESKIALVMNAENYIERHHSNRNGHKARLGCYFCYRVIEVREFAISRDQLSRDPSSRQALRRFCISCGISKGYHKPGDMLERRDGTMWWICACKRIQDKGTTLVCNRCRMHVPYRQSVRDELGDE